MKRKIWLPGGGRGYFKVVVYELALVGLLLIPSPVHVTAGPAAIEGDASFFAPGREVVTPHIVWADPSAGGPLRVLFIGKTSGMREVVELAQRLEIVYDFWGVPYDKMTWHNAVDNDFWGGYIKGSRPEEHIERLKQLLQNDYDLFVLGAFDWKAFPLFAKYRILQQVKNGAGLLKVSSGDYGARSDEYLDQAVRKRLDIPTVLFQGFPWQALPVFASYSNATAFIAGTLAASQLGHGRIVQIQGYVVPEMQLICPGFTANPLWRKSAQQTAKAAESSNPEFNLPIADIQPLDYDYYCAFVIKTMLFAAGKPPALAIEEDGLVRELARENLSQLGFQVRAPAAMTADLHFVLRDRANAIIADAARQNVPLTGERQSVDFSIPPITAGRYFADLWIKQGGRIITFGSVALSVRSAAHIRGLKLTQDAWRVGERITAELDIEPGSVSLENLSVRITQKDNFDRVVRRETQKIQKVKTTLDLAPVPMPLTICQRLEIALLAGDIPVDRKIVPFYHSNLPNPETIRLGIWQWPYTSYVSWRQHEKIFQDGFDSVYWVYGSDYYMQAFGFNRTLKNGRAEIAAHANLRIMPCVLKFRDQACWSGNFDAKGNILKVQEGIRLPCLNDPAYRQGLTDRARAIVDYFGRFSGAEYLCGDEMSFAHNGREDLELCFCPHCKEFFRQFLKKNYGSLAALNAEYETGYRDFSEIEPVKLRAALDNRRLAPVWADFRMAMEATYSGIFALLAETVHSGRPDARFGYESSLHGGYDSWQAEDVWLISRWAQIASPYEECFGGQVRADFARPDMLLGQSTVGFYAPNWSREFMTLNPWSDLFRGANLFLSWTGAYAPDLSIYDVFQPYLEQMREIKNGTGQLIHNAERRPGTTALLVSQPSVHQWTLTEGLLNSHSMKINYEAWHAILTDANQSYRVISSEQLRQGILKDGAFKLLILPWAQALSQRETDEIKRFAAGGGVVLADLRPGVSDEHCKPYAQSPLDELFGVIQNTKQGDLKKISIPLPSATNGASESLGEGRCDLSLTVNSNASGMAARAEAPLMISHAYKRGQGILLNFSVDNYVRFRESISAMRIPFIRTAGAPLILRFFKHLRDELGLMPELRYTPELNDLREYRFSSGPIHYLGLLQELPDPDMKKYAAGTAAPPLIVNKTAVQLPAQAHIYDVRSGRYEGYSNQITAFIKPGIAKLYALMPYRVDGLDIKAPPTVLPGSDWPYAVTLKTAGALGAHVLHILISGPDGKELQYYNQNVDCRKGKYEGQWHPALNETPGIYTFTVRDAATGVTGQKTVEVKGDSRP